MSTAVCSACNVNTRCEACQLEINAALALVQTTPPGQPLGEYAEILPVEAFHYIAMLLKPWTHVQESKHCCSKCPKVFVSDLALAKHATLHHYDWVVHLYEQPDINIPTEPAWIPNTALHTLRDGLRGVLGEEWLPVVGAIDIIWLYATEHVMSLCQAITSHVNMDMQGGLGMHKRMHQFIEQFISYTDSFRVKCSQRQAVEPVPLERSLKTCVRQQDDQGFLTMLNEIRVGEPSVETVELLKLRTASSRSTRSCTESADVAHAVANRRHDVSLLAGGFIVLVFDLDVYEVDLCTLRAHKIMRKIVTNLSQKLNPDKKLVWTKPRHFCPPKEENESVDDLVYATISTCFLRRYEKERYPPIVAMVEVTNPIDIARSINWSAIQTEFEFDLKTSSHPPLRADAEAGLVEPTINYRLQDQEEAIIDMEDGRHLVLVSADIMSDD